MFRLHGAVYYLVSASPRTDYIASPLSKKGTLPSLVRLRLVARLSGQSHRLSVFDYSLRLLSKETCQTRTVIYVLNRLDSSYAKSTEFIIGYARK